MSILSVKNFSNAHISEPGFILLVVYVRDGVLQDLLFHKKAETPYKDKKINWTLFLSPPRYLHMKNVRMSPRQ